MSRHAMVEVNCEWCGNSFVARKQRVEKGQSRFCSREHYQEWKKQNPEIGNLGKENATIHFDKRDSIYKAYWIDPETMKLKSTTWARWAWEVNFGEIPDGYRVSFRDGNSLNAVLENLFLKHLSEYTEIGDRNRGASKSVETRKKLSEAHTGKTLSDKHRENIGRATRKMWMDGVFDSPETRAAYSRQGKATKGSKRTEEQRRKISESHRGMSMPWLHTPEAIAKRVAKLIGKQQSKEANQRRSLAQKGRVFTEEHRLNLSKSLKGLYTGENASGFKDGKSLSPYPRDFGAYIKSYIRRRDNYECQSCGENVRGKGKGQVHHIDNIKENTDEDNLILLCVPCHQAVHGKKNITNEMIEYLKSRLTR